MAIHYFPAVRVRKYNPENAATRRAWLIYKCCAIQFAQLTGDIKSQSRTTATVGKKRFEYFIDSCRIDTVTLIKNLEKRPARPLHAVRLQLDQDSAGFACVFYRVVAQIPQYLSQVCGIHAHHQVVRNVGYGQLPFLKFERTRKFLGELQADRMQRLGSANTILKMLPPGVRG